MMVLKNLVPMNLQEEKQKFFSDPTYNPQFIFADQVDESALDRYGLPQRPCLDLAQTILDTTYRDASESDLFASEGPKMSQQEITQKITNFLNMHNLEKRFKIVWSSSFISRTSVTTDTIKLRLPPDFRKEGLLGMLYHEIGTHALRRINYEHQAWYKKKNKNGFKDHLRTEEGLAALHALIPHTNKSAFIQAIRYVAVEYAREHSFVEVWNFLKKYVDDAERRWVITFRQKRGMTDTSKPGGYTKDLVYFEGLVDTWRYLNIHDFDITTLYFGKLAYEDSDKAKSFNPHFIPMLPSFFITNPEEYKTQMRLIGKANLLA